MTDDTRNTVTQPHPPETLLRWLHCESYMMKQLVSIAGDAQLTVIQQRWEPLNAWDKQTLSLEDGWVLHRDVVVTAWGNPCWFARTIIPQATYVAHRALFERLNGEPLGNLMFQTQGIKRLNLDCLAIAPGSVEYSWLPTPLAISPQVLWMRCSTVRIHDVERFVLVEILLPDLERYC